MSRRAETKEGVDGGGAHLLMRDDERTGPPDTRIGRMGDKDPAILSRRAS